MVLVPLNRDGEALASLPGSEFVNGKDVDAAVLAPFLSAHTAEVPNAEEVFESAVQKAKQEGKRVLVQQCSRDRESLKLSRWLDRHREAIELDYVWISVDKSWPGGAEVVAKLGDDENAGSPWLGILDAKGDVQNSSDKLGQLQSPMYRIANLFEKLMRPAAKKMTALDVDLMIDDLRNP